ncbi:hypothetical protein [Hymenobacter sp. B81]|uniref:hypothetical protein n=1 Tax=Hymenobacter sp. B81 TaxID=3344878 RepID=UPI0037DC3460
MTKRFLLLAGWALALGSCDRAKDTARTTIQKTGEAVGQSATVLANGVAVGIGKGTGRRLKLSADLQQRGLQVGKVQVGRADSARLDNRLTVYFIFQQRFADTVLVKLFDESGREYGRRKHFLAARADEAFNADIVFDERTDIELGTQVTVE